jgi:partition protein
MKKHKGSMLTYLNPETQSAAIQRSVYHVENIDAEKIIPNEKNFYSVEGIEEMANSLSVSDHMAPLEVIANGDGTYRLISGERRLSATLCRIRRGEIDKAELPCHVLPAFEAKGALSAEQVEMLSIIFANNYRQKTVLDQLNEVKQLEPIARAIYQEAKEKGELADETGANMKFRTFFAEHVLSMSKSALQRLQSLEQLSDDAKVAFEDGAISKSVATELASLDEEEQDTFVASVRAGEISGTLADLEIHRNGSSETESASFFSEEEYEEEESSDGSILIQEPMNLPQEQHPLPEKPKSLETTLEEVEGQKRLPLVGDLSELEGSEAADSSDERLSPVEAVNTLLEMLADMKAEGQTQKAAAIDFALDTMKYRYAWIKYPKVRSV